MSNDLYGITVDGRVVKAMVGIKWMDSGEVCSKCVFRNSARNCVDTRRKAAPAVFNKDFPGCGVLDIRGWEYVEDEQSFTRGG